MAAANEGSQRLRWLSVLVCLVALSAHACHATAIPLSGMYGVLVTPGYPAPYEDDRDLQWLITVPEGFRVRLYISDFDLEPGTMNCDHDYLMVLSGNDTLGKFCGRAGTRDAPGDRSLTSQSREMEVRFHADYSNVHRRTGFRAHYVAEDIDECEERDICNHFCHNYLGGYYCSCEFGYSLHEDNTSCEVHCSGNILEATSGVITSPGYPIAYPRRSDCDWLIRAEAGYVISLTFEDFDVEDHPDVKCPYDALSIKQDDERLGPFCGRQKADWPEEVKADKRIEISFVSDASGANRGFRARYSTAGKPCVALDVPANGVVSVSNTTMGHNATFSCERGFRLVGPAQRTCLASGQWSDSNPVCEVVTCESLVDINNGQVTVDDETLEWGTEAVYYCDPLYELRGSDTRVCQVDGEWSGEEPSCVAICGESRTPPRNPPRRRIVGGREARKNSWPWAARISIRAPNFGIDGIQCGGSLISETWVLTAAHCVTARRTAIFGRVVPADSVSVTLGIHEISDTKGEVREVSEIVRAPSYDAASFDADVALLRLAQPVALTNRISPICVPDADTFRVGSDYSLYEDEEFLEEAVAIGWGETEPGSTSDFLKEVYLPVIDQSTCVESFEGRAQEGYVITDNMVCAGASEGGRDTCFGDSGGPLMLKDRVLERYHAFGLISWGEDRCAQEGDYGVYAKVGNFGTWIRQITQM
ncbi:mannan-binding lectin serine protease 1-like [Patiria miniata]|uniref:Uncharacterized protein n=1 Tax=Patiria miniata TaxID=46514 RepID=A0A914ADJ4_PATMI|nr:mannan-binding lectin serine protease 1-like [Patiria miniata]